ncbi:unnamed protein product [Toxocara canis]|uniref:DTHCT domain-containing protein n=1 Tax=Toxocara canis TaxID=6265 RepID=A0A183U4D6_TOXCA|nr:unnamed protein product [Toxocara canis]
MEDEEQETVQKKKRGLKVKIRKLLGGQATADGKSLVKQEEAREVAAQGKSRVKQEESREVVRLMHESKQQKRKPDDKKSKPVFSLTNLFGKPSAKKQPSKKVEMSRAVKKKKQKKVSSSESEQSSSSSDDGESELCEKLHGDSLAITSSYFLRYLVIYGIKTCSFDICTMDFQLMASGDPSQMMSTVGDTDLKFNYLFMAVGWSGKFVSGS